jgi:nucleoside-diphosphate-sugar epimerase
MQYLILGSSGQIGSGLLQHISKTEHNAIEFDLVRDAEEDLRITNNKKLDKAVKNADFVFFLAFDVGGARYLKKYQETYEFMSNNLKLMANTFDVIRRHKKPFIFVSSQMSSINNSNYGLLKRLGEKITDSLNGIVVKCWNIYGLESDLERSHVITDLILKADRTSKIDLITNGEEERQFLHVEDCSRCLLTLAEKYTEISRDQPLHITSFIWTKVIDLAKMISTNFDNIEVVPTLDPSAAKNDTQYLIKNEPSDYILNFWKPEIEIESGIKDIIRQMKEKKMIK